MHQLSGLDTTFLNIETPTTHGHVSGLALFDPSTARRVLGFEEIKELIRSRLHLFPPYRWRLVEVPFGIDQPYWVEDPHFDLDFHVRQLAVPAPGTRRQLIELVERVAARPLDRRRPLWEMYLIEGLEDGKTAQLTKIHHAAIDGVAGSDALAVGLDLTPEPRVVDPPATPWTPDRIPSDAEMFQRGLASLQTKPARDFKLWTEWLASLSNPAGGAARPRPQSTPTDEGARPSRMVQHPPPRTSFNALIGPHRRWSFTSISLDDVKVLKNAYGVTVNDIILALCGGALRRYLDERDELPDTSLIAMVPVSVRGDDHGGGVGNRVGSVTTSLHTEIDDVAERVALTHESMDEAKTAHDAVPADLLLDLAEYYPPAIAGLVARNAARAAAERQSHLQYNVVISNVPGAQFPLYGAGALMVGNYPFSTITDGVGLNITAQSYNGQIDIGVLGCRDLVPDTDIIIRHLLDSKAELETVAGLTRKVARKTPASRTPTKKKAAAKKNVAKTPAKPAAKKTTTKKRTTK